MRMLFAKFNSILSCDSRYFFLKYTPFPRLDLYAVYVSNAIKLLCFKLSSNELSGSRKKSQNVENLQTDRRQKKKYVIRKVNSKLRFR